MIGRLVGNGMRFIECFLGSKRPAQPVDGIRVKGRIHIEVKRAATGKVDVYDFENTVMLAGKDDILNVYFHAGTQKTTWYMGLVDNTSFSAIANTDTMAAHPGWLENQHYSGGARPTWTEGASSGQSMTNASAVVFNINANSQVINGIFITSDNTLGGTAGLLWAAGSFGSTIACNSGDQVQATYTISVT